MILLLLGGTGAWWVTAIAPVDISDKSQKTFTIEEGQGIREIANNLKAEGLINDTVAFFLLVKQMGIDENVQAGDFYLSPSMNATTIAKALQVGAFDTRVTIPEGKRAEEIADILQKNIPGFQDYWRQELVKQEGYLFPDTYSFANDASLETIITTMNQNFEKKYATIPQHTKNLTQQDIVTIASMVEREARFAEDRPLVASVILNRLGIDMALQIDATVQYALGTPQDWWPTLTDSPKNLVPDSPYNTYTHTGLPPTPIANPGIDALNAVLTAPETNYIYYITNPETGRNVYAETLTEHNANIKKYGL